MTPIIIIIAAFIGVATLVGGVAVMFSRRSGAEVEDRLDVLTGVSSGDGRLEEQSVLAQPLDDMPGYLEEAVSRFLNFRRILDQANMQISVPKFFVIVGALAAGGSALTLVTPLHPGFAPLIGISLAILPFFWLHVKRGQRMGKFAKQLPEALELVSRALRAGHSLASGFHLVGTEMSAPVSTEFLRVFEEQNLGIPLDEALDQMTERMPNLDLRFFATAVILQRQTGGDLAEILDKIGKLIRARFKIYGQIQALTGEGRLSGIVLLALPPVLFLTMLRLNYEYIMILFRDPWGGQLLAVAIFMQFLGAITIRKIINIKV
jgi:tight adherence protein B